MNQQGNAVILMQVDIASQTPKASVGNFVNREGINVLRQTSTESNGLPAHEAIATVQTQDGEKLGLYAYSLRYDGTVYRFISYTDEDRFENFMPEFEETATGFDRLTDRDILSIRPVRLQSVQTDRSGIFTSFLPDQLPMDITKEEVAIMNQVRLNDRIEEGTFLKIPEL